MIRNSVGGTGGHCGKSRKVGIYSQMLYNLHIECIKVNVVETGGNSEELLRMGMGRGRWRLKNPKLRLEI